MKTSTFWVAYLLIFSAKPLLANENNLQIYLSNDEVRQLHVSAQQASFEQVLGKIALETGIPIHYQSLSGQLVTVTCADARIEQVLDCLFDDKANLIVRYPQSESKHHLLSDQPAEIWVLGKNEDIDQESTVEQSGIKSKSAVSARNLAVQADLLQSQPLLGQNATDTQLEMTPSDGPAQRSMAISALAVEGTDNGQAVRATLEAAFLDSDPGVRAQAVSALERREGPAALPMLQQALQDEDVSVRLMAIDHAGGHADLLQQALADSDITVRTLATLKLEEIAHSTSVH